MMKSLGKSKSKDKHPHPHTAATTAAATTSTDEPRVPSIVVSTIGSGSQLNKEHDHDMDATLDDDGTFNMARLLRSPDEHDTAALEVMEVFAGGKRVNLARLKVDFEMAQRTISATFQHREQIFRTLHGRGRLSNVLGQATGVIFWSLATVAVVASVVGFELLFETLAPVLSLSLGLAFVIADPAKDTFNAMVLLFVRAPFIVGDRISLPDEHYPDLIVDKISLLSTTGHSADGRVWIVPNKKLASTTIISHQRSTSYSFSLVVSILPDGFDLDVLNDIASSLKQFVKMDRSATWIPSSLAVRTTSLDEHARMAITVWVSLKGVDWTMVGVYLSAQSILRMQLCALLDQHGIIYHNPKPMGPKKGGVSPPSAPSASDKPVKQD